jgi:hypothetical protein
MKTTDLRQLRQNDIAIWVGPKHKPKVSKIQDPSLSDFMIRDLGEDFREGRGVGAVSLPVFYQDYAWWQSSLSCWLVEARCNFCTTSNLIRELAYRLGKSLDDRKIHHHFMDTCLTTESGPSFMFKMRHLGDSETIVSRSVKTA